MCPSESHKAALGLAYFTVVVMLCTLCLGIYWMFWPVDILDVKSIEIMNRNVKAGTAVHYTICYNKYKDEPGEVTKMLITKDDTRYYSLVAHFLGAIPPGINKCAESLTLIPSYIPPGTYKMRYIIKYQISPIRTFMEVFETPYFRITKTQQSNKYNAKTEAPLSKHNGILGWR